MSFTSTENFYKDVPYLDYEKHLTPYNKPHYAEFEKQCKKFVDECVLPNWDKWEQNESVPLSLYKQAYQYGILTPDYPKKYGGQPFKDQPWDFFMDMIRAAQLARTGSAAPLTTLWIHKIVIPAILHFGNEYHKSMITPILKGEKIGALAISEPTTGSDVSRIKCTAVKDGDYYIVNGMKKWISNGMKAEYYLTAVRTGGPGAAGISVLLIPKIKGVITSRIKTQGHKTSETTLIIFNNVKVPCKNLLGKENNGFKIIMFNFNSERMGINIYTNALSKICFLESIKYAKERYTFRKPLIKHQVIRHKIAEMGRMILATHCLIEKLCFRLMNDQLARNNYSLSGAVALCKVQCTKTLEFVARESSQILGGASYVLGKKIERVYREVRGLAIYGGSEEIMLDLGIKLGLKNITPKNLSFSNCPIVDWENHKSPYSTPRQARWRELCKKFVDNEILPNISKWEKNWDIPTDSYKIAYKYGIYGARYPKEYCGTPFENQGYDQFLNYIMYEQLSRAGAGGLFSSMWIQTISIPPVIHFGNEFQKKLMIECIKANEIAALAISEPNAGSDVANVSTLAINDGNGYFIVNGMKKWISNGTKAKWFITAVRTNKNIKGTKGISLLIIPRIKGVITSRIKTQGHHSSHTSLVIFNNVKVPVTYLLGKEFHGFKMIMYNFNQERFGISCQALGLSKVLIYESIKYGFKRSTFGKQLITHQVIRHKLSEMCRHVLSTYCLMEKLGYGLINDPLGEKDKSIGGNIALFKVQSTKTLEYCAREASQIFGGASYVENSIIDRIYRDVRGFAIYGGSEEIMSDVSLRLAKL